MTEFFVNTVFDLSEKSENRVAQITVKLLFYFNCAIIAIWISELIGWGFNGTELGLDSAMDFVFSLQVLIPVFLFLFVLVGMKTVSRILAVLAVQFLRWPVHVLYYDKMSYPEYLISQKAMTADQRKGDNYDTHLRTIGKRRKIIKEGQYWIEYSFNFLLSLTLIYNVVVPAYFEALFYSWVNVFILLYTIFVFSVHVFILYITTTDNKIETLLKSAKD